MKRFISMWAKPVLLCLSATGLATFASSASAASSGALRAGAAKIEYAAAPSPKYEHERLYIRAIVIDNGATRGALIGLDLGNLSGGIWESAAPKIAAELNSPVENIIISATHTHSAAGRRPNGESIQPDLEKFTNQILDAVKQAKAKLQPARMGYGTGMSYLNVNRDAINPATHLWTQAPNLIAPSDKTVAVLKFEATNGKPIGAYVNYAMHPVNGYLSGLVSGDFADAMSRYVEQAYDDSMVAVFTQGASGDQNPLYLRASTNVMAAKAGIPITGNVLVREDVESNLRGTDFKQLTPDPKVVDRLARFIESQGAMLGEEVIRVMTNTTRTLSEARIAGAQKVASCPGRDRTDKGREGMVGTYKDGEPVNIRIGMLGIGDVALTTVNAEVYNLIAQRTKLQSPMANTMVVTIANGRANSGYIPDDASFSHNTFQVLGSRLKIGCAEAAIANGLTEMVGQYSKQ